MVDIDNPNPNHFPCANPGTCIQYKGLHFPSTADSGTTGSFFKDFTWGTEVRTSRETSARSQLSPYPHTNTSLYQHDQIL